MKTTATSILFLASLVSAKHAVHEHLHALHRRHHEQAVRSMPETAEHGVEVRAAAPETATPEKRQAQCSFPYNAGLVPVTPGSQNAGWAMSPNQPCTPGNYCPYACPPGQVMMQWDPSATSYTYPKSMVSRSESNSSARTDLNRTVASFATTMATSTNLSLRNHIASQPQATLAS